MEVTPTQSKLDDEINNLNQSLSTKTLALEKAYSRIADLENALFKQSEAVGPKQLVKLK